MAGRSAGDKIERKYLAHFIDETFGGSTASYTRIGKDLEEYTIEMNPDGESKKNILGETSYTLKGYEPSGSVGTQYCYEDDAMYGQLESIVNGRLTGSDCKTTVIDAVLDTDGTVVSAYKEDAIIEVQSIGGDTGGMQIPYNIHYAGNRTAVTGTVTNGKFVIGS
jgi:hypothetical protein